MGGPEYLMKRFCSFAVDALPLEWRQTLVK
jgi:hypothetical protein